MTIWNLKKDFLALAGSHRKNVQAAADCAIGRHRAFIILAIKPESNIIIIKKSVTMPENGEGRAFYSTGVCHACGKRWENCVESKNVSSSEGIFTKQNWQNWIFAADRLLPLRLDHQQKIFFFFFVISGFFVPNIFFFHLHTPRAIPQVYGNSCWLSTIWYTTISA